MKKTLLLLPLLILCACDAATGTSSNNVSLSETSSSEASSIESASSNITSLEDTSSEETTTSEESSLELPLLDNNLFGKWYVSSTANSILNINDEIDVYEDGHMVVRQLTCYYVGQFGEYEGSYAFKSESKRTTFVLQMIDETLAWGYEDTSDKSDFGYAEREPFSNEIKYAYEGTEWPMQQINEFINTTGSIPAFESNYYRLHTGVSSLYDIDYCMVDIENAEEGSARSYVTYLNNNGFEISKDSSSNFYVGQDTDQMYYVRIIEFTDDKNLCIFVYNYNSFINR